MKKLKLFPKTFLYTFFMLLLINLSMHLMIYFFYPKVYLNRMEKDLENKIQKLHEEIAVSTENEIGTILSYFAKQNHVNVTIETDGNEKTYQGMEFDISLAIDVGAVFSVNNLGDAQSIIIKNHVLEKSDGTDLKIQVMASAHPLKEASDMIRFLLPFTFVATIVFSVVFAYFYSKKITNPILNMLKVTTDMKNRKPDAAFHVQTMDEMGILAEQINEVYDCLLLTIQRLDQEKEHMLEVEKSKTVFLRSASHELKTPLAGLRILLENMQYQIGKYKDRDTYLGKAVDMVDQLTSMVQDILDTSKLQEKLSEKENKKFFIKNEITEILKDYALQISKHGLDLKMQIPEELTVCMKEGSFGQIWSNLISNAVRYTDMGGKITIATDSQEMWIENSCTPLTAAQLKYIFEPFYRPDETRNMQGGSGLGLYVVSEILKKEGFSYAFEPFEEGMRFRIGLTRKHMM